MFLACTRSIFCISIMDVKRPACTVSVSGLMDLRSLLPRILKSGLIIDVPQAYGIKIPWKYASGLKLN